jgi:hypothetical protein
MPRYALYKSERVVFRGKPCGTDERPVLEYVECGETDNLQAAQDHMNSAPGNTYKKIDPADRTDNR